MNDTFSPTADNILPRQPKAAGASLSKNPFGLFRQFLQSAARTPRAPLAYNSHTCSLSGVFVHVHAAAKNDLTLFSAAAENSVKLIYQVTPAAKSCQGFMFSYFSRITAHWPASRAALMCSAASAGVSFTCSPVFMFFTEHLPSAISSSPSRTAKGTPSLLA